MAANVVAVSEVVATAESELDALKVHTENLKNEATQLDFDLERFQCRFKDI